MPTDLEAITVGVKLLDFIKDHAEWSEKTFGTTVERGPVGPLKHLSKEASEAVEAYQRVIKFVNTDTALATTAADGYQEELADIGLLWLDAIRRSGFDIYSMLRAMDKKLAKCKTRHYPPAPATEPAEHYRGYTPKPGEEIAIGKIGRVNHEGHLVSMPNPRPTIVCLCGSTKFKEQFIQANFYETLNGNIVLSVGWFSHTDSEIYTPTDNEKKKLDELHLRKIDLADEILVINKDGYIGDSTRNEIKYAVAHSKNVRWMFPDKIPTL